MGKIFFLLGPPPKRGEKELLIGKKKRGPPDMCYTPFTLGLRPKGLRRQKFPTQRGF